MPGEDVVNTAIHWAGPVLIIGALAFGPTIVLISRQPVIGMSMGQEAASVALCSAALLLLRDSRDGGRRVSVSPSDRSGSIADQLGQEC